MWIDHLQHDPLTVLLASSDHALVFQTERFLCDALSDPREHLWELPQPQSMIRKQQSNGSWCYRGNRPGDKYGENYELLETWRNLNVLVEKFLFDRRHPSIQTAVEFMLSCQTGEGDIRGILSNQYNPYYMGVMLETLIKTGYPSDVRILKAFKWLESHQQEEGGWIIPMAMFKMQDYYRLCQGDPIPPNKKMPFSHMATGMVIRAYAAHPAFRGSTSAIAAGKLLKSRLFQKDTFTSRQAVHYWFKFQFPFWWTNLLTVLDSLAHIGFEASDHDIKKGLDWFIQHQNPDGTWGTGYGSKRDLWVTFAICRVIKHYLE